MFNDANDSVRVIVSMPCALPGEVADAVNRHFHDNSPQLTAKQVEDMDEEGIIPLCPVLDNSGRRQIDCPHAKGEGELSFRPICAVEGCFYTQLAV